MTSYTVTLKAHLTRGCFYWVTTVSAASEEEALVAAENLFEAEMETATDWAFDEFDAAPAQEAGPG